MSKQNIVKVNNKRVKGILVHPTALNQTITPNDTTASPYTIENGYTAFVNNRRVVGRATFIDTNSKTVYPNTIDHNRTTYSGNTKITGKYIKDDTLRYTANPEDIKQGKTFTDGKRKNILSGTSDSVLLQDTSSINIDENNIFLGYFYYSTNKQRMGLLVPQELQDKNTPTNVSNSVKINIKKPISAYHSFEPASSETVASGYKFYSLHPTTKKLEERTGNLNLTPKENISFAFTKSLSFQYPLNFLSDNYLTMLNGYYSGSTPLVFYTNYLTSYYINLSAYTCIGNSLPPNAQGGYGGGLVSIIYGDNLYLLADFIYYNLSYIRVVVRSSRFYINICFSLRTTILGSGGGSITYTNSRFDCLMFI